MKINELRSIIREVIAEEIANESVNKKQLAINEIKRIISENEITEEDLVSEIDLSSFFKKSTPEGKLAKLEAELKEKSPETYNSWVATIDKLGWKKDGKFEWMIESIEKYDKGWGYPKDGKYYTRNISGKEKLFFDTEKKSKLGVKVF